MAGSMASNERSNAREDRMERFASMVGTATERAKEFVDTAGHTAEHAVRNTGHFVQHVSAGDMGDITEDIAATVRRYPIPALLISFGLGLFLGSRR
jgi:hypothetical protein